MDDKPPEAFLALLWWLADETNRVLVSAASGWEISTKVRLGQLPVASELVENLPRLPAFPCQLLW
jgi:PIN domain nuclease of toxin-antitoxin system